MACVPEARLGLPVEMNGHADLLWAQNPACGYVSRSTYPGELTGPSGCGEWPLQCLVGSWRELRYLSLEEEYDSLGATLRSKN